MTFSTVIFQLVERLLLARLSVHAMETVTITAYICQIFQISCVAIAMMAQIDVGRWHGAGEWKRIGPGVWQMIWFSFLSMLATVPLSLIYGRHYLRGSGVESIALPYLYFIVAINFLYPLGAALTGFYLGRRETRFVLCMTIAFQGMKILLGYLLIVGWKDWIPSFGLLGGVMSTLIAQGGFCIVLLVVFLKEKHAKIYHSRHWHFNRKLFWHGIYPGTLRAINRILNGTSWASIAGLMTARGETHLLILTIGGTVFLLFSFIGDALLQAQTTSISNSIGAQNESMMHRAFRSGSQLALVGIALAGIPLLFLPIQTYDYLFPTIALEEGLVRNVFFGLWLCLGFHIFSSVLTAYILAFKDTKFSCFMGGVNWINGFLLMFVFLEKVGISADQFWTALSLMHGSTLIIYYFRMKWLQAAAYSSAITIPSIKLGTSSN
ncbi:MAG: MATE family efflux transporter [Waddliaceae bacterium]